MTGPRRIRDLDDVPRDQWHTDERSVFAWRGRIWTVEAVGCVLCVELDHRTTISTKTDAGDLLYCAIHEWLIEVPYVLTRQIQIGDVHREEVASDTMLFPADMMPADRTALIESLLDEAGAELDAAERR